MSEKQKADILKKAFELRTLKKADLIRYGRERNITFSNKDKAEDMVIKIMTAHIDDSKIF